MNYSTGKKLLLVAKAIKNGSKIAVVLNFFVNMLLSGAL